MPILDRLRRRSIAYNNPRVVRDMLAEQASKTRTARTRHHQDGASRIDGDKLGFQPGLTELHGEMADMEVYLEALAAEAQRRGHREVARRIDTAVRTAQQLRDAIGAAAEATT
jgi:hypothetical protein